MTKFIKIILILSILQSIKTTQEQQIETNLQLRQIQLIHTHGDRTPGQFVLNDPYSVVSHFWPEGIGQLTKIGRNRMYMVGKYLHRIYEKFLNNELNQTNIENFIKVYSSSYRRCLESATILTAGLINVKQSSIHNDTTEFDKLNKLWTTIPVKSFSSKGNDPLLDVDFNCVNLEKLFHRITAQDYRIKQAEHENQEFMNEISFYAGERINSLKSANLLYQELFIEQQSNYHWYQRPYEIWTKNYQSYAIEKLHELSKIYWTLYYDNQLIQKLISGQLLFEINNNIRNYIRNINRKTKIFIYSTHDGKIVSLLQSLNIYNTYLISPGATLIFELYQNQSNHNDYYIKFYYFNQTFSINQITNDQIGYEIYPHDYCPIKQKLCNVNYYLTKINKQETMDIDYECGNNQHYYISEKINLTLLITNGILFIIFLLSINLYIFKFIKYK